MTRTLTALALAGVLLFAGPAAAHLKSFEDGTNDAYQAGNTDTTAQVTPLDLSGGSFREKPANYKFVLSLHEALDTNLLCSEAACSGDTIESHGFFFADFYRSVDGAQKNYSFIHAATAGEGGLIAGLFKLTSSGVEFVANATATLSDDGMKVTLKAPRNKIKGHTEGRKIFWNTTSAWWEPSDSDHCLFDSNEAYANACVDWIPDASDAPHKLQN
jgi:hypothetical protein